MYQLDNLRNAKPINTEQVEQIIKAIIAGKYSWACVLMLRFSGYNPIDYIPYRTYIRLLKNNYLLHGAKPKETNASEQKIGVFDIKSNWVRS
ncbi:HetP family heterocyst commitment protein [Nostoc sp. FACHB-87]|uniref:HetP family heterocyst commitment protein n=1 Tax=Nostocales TaxID=1161 RepID=UPI001683C166|nr:MULTISPECIES: HetP family heterocyst commitment protein [Nostocales]MBD2297632.1 HetP family heterocyst commitment protein [Nostoc sp. FACHB-190]MBD2453841.1 HetP family heterocyst commitment protein [Nostoc sp. FACHB-87]MBD2475963.1 HetP family heterocyst commitment protein [Anabaena sp. FACHB-83]MBD2487385.1 HetP family heterocyst commitment protein [Aulosira sp. FACHB-615]